MKRCTKLADTLVTGEPLSESDREHLAGCTDCAQLQATARLMGATATASAAEVGPGFTARVIAGARERMESRRRQRFVGFGLVAVAAAGAAVLVISASRDRGRSDHAPHAVRPAGGNLGIEAPDPGPGDDGITDDELRELVGGTRLSRAFEPVADWDDIEAPVSNYRAVLRLGGEP